MKVYQIAIKGRQPQGAMFATRPEAEREVRFLIQDDRRYASEAMHEAGIVVPPTEYEIVEMELN